ncbi:site-specific DNA-methyltransferase [Chloroflexota bacterium]
MKIKEQIELQQISIDELHPDPANPRRISDQELEALTRSIREFGLVDPIIARREDKTVIGGHQRLLAARRLGHKTVPVIFADLSLEQARLFNIALNKISGSFDQELLARLLEDLGKTPDVDLTLSGFGEDELKKLLKSLDAREKRERVEDFDLEEAIKAAQSAPVAKQGDIWLLGDNKLACGDSTDGEAVQRLMEQSRATMVFTDPPYNVDYGSSKNPRHKIRSIENDNQNSGDWEAFCKAMFSNFKLFNAGDIYMWGASGPDGMRMRLWLVEMGCHWSATIVWKKQQLVLSPANYQRIYEPCFYGWFDKSSFRGDRKQTEVWETDRPLKSDLHPTMKPLPLIERAIQNSSEPGDKVMDLFLGSGSTLIACERTGRICYGMELEPLYVDIAKMRWEAFTGEKARLCEEEKE